MTGKTFQCYKTFYFAFGEQRRCGMVEKHAGPHGYGQFEGPPPVARRTDPATSHRAAQSVHHSDRTRERVYQLLADLGPMTDEEIFAAYAQTHAPEIASPSGLRTRRSELVTQGRVMDSTERRPTAAGRDSIVWTAKRGQPPA